MPKAEIPLLYDGLPVLTAAQVRELDRLATEKKGIPALTLMENAGKAVAAETVAFLGGASKTIVVCCGRGANGGDGLVAARYLAEGGAKVSAFICPPKKDSPYPDVVRANQDRARAAGVTLREAGEGCGLDEALASADAALDALLGTGSAGKPAGPVHHMIQALTRSKKPVIAVDIPSGIHPDTGYHSGVYVTAALTLTLGWPKRGLVTPHAQRFVGRLKVLDIGYPADLVSLLPRPNL
jgi:NAD(P)H-hydrate epimerase